MTFSHIAYIDEAGDEGFGKLKNPDAGGQSQWLLIGCALVTSDNDRDLPAWRDDILKLFPKARARDLHFRTLNHDQRVVSCQKIAERPIWIAVTCSNKATIPGSRYADLFKKPGHLYNYLTRWLLERITTMCAEDAAARKIEPRLKVVFSRRGGTNYQAMHEYMVLMRDGREKIRPVRGINWKVLDPSDIVVEAHDKWAGLQIADAATSAFFKALEPNAYSNTEPRYAEILRPNLIARNGVALGCGITPVPSLVGANDATKAFFLSFGKKE